MGKRSTVKGARFERELVKIFRKYWRINFERTPQSGGWGKLRTKGDLLVDPALYPNWAFYVEAKKQEGWELSIGLPSIIDGWWSKAREQACEERRVPLLIFSKNFTGKYIRFYPGELNVIHGPTTGISMAFPLKIPFTHLKVIDGSVIMCLEDFFKIFDHGWLKWYVETTVDESSGTAGVPEV